MFAGNRKEQKLASLALLGWCDAGAIRTIARCADEVNVRAGQVLCRATDRVRPFLILLDGRAEVVGAGAPPRLLTAGESYGAEAILRDTDEVVEARMLTDGRVLVLEPRTFRRLAAKVPGLGLGVARELARRITTTERAREA